MSSEPHQEELRKPYGFLLHGNLVIGFLIGALAGTKIAMLLAPEHPSLRLWVLACLGLLIAFSVATSLTFNAILSGALLLFGKISKAEARGLMFRLKTPASLTKPMNEKSVK